MGEFLGDNQAAGPRWVWALWRLYNVIYIPHVRYSNLRGDILVLDSLFARIKIIQSMRSAEHSIFPEPPYTAPYKLDVFIQFHPRDTHHRQAKDKRHTDRLKASSVDPPNHCSTTWRY